jgi:hypothetical protein
MIGAKHRYGELLIQLLLFRELACGELPPEDEARLVSELDRCWREMTDEERQETERGFAERWVPAAPDSLHEEDLVVPDGSRIGPRRAA